MTDTPQPIRTFTNMAAYDTPATSPMAAKPVPGSDISAPASDPAVDVTLSLFSDTHGVPYTAHFFELSYMYDDPLFKDLRLKVHEIEDYVRHKMDERNLKDTMEAYHEVLDEVHEMIGKYETEKAESVFNRLATAVSAINRLESAKIEPVLTVDTLLPSEYENIQYEK